MPAHTPPSPEPSHSAILFWLTLTALVWSGVLLFAGGFTTSIGAGMAFLDWPLSNGSLNPEGWTENIDQMAEHGHRLAGMIIGLLSITLAIAYYRIETRVWVRRLAYFLLLLVVLQGILGGLRVRLDHLNTGSDHNLVARSFAIAHAMGAEGVMVTLCSLAVLSAPRWFRAGSASSGGPTRAFGVTAFGLLVIAILIGAVMRHNGAALAIPTFPAAAPDGSWITDSDQFAVWVHFIHRTLGMIGGLGVLVYAILASRQKGWHSYAKQFALAAVLLTGLQIWLGWLILETIRNPHVATLHMLNGAVLLSTLWASILWSTRDRHGPESEQSEPSHAH
jgi:cytochrome c oxidase assembly protein subunit 15